MIDKLIIVTVPERATNIQVWNHGIGFKCNDLIIETDTNEFHHIYTGLGRWVDIDIVGTITRSGDFDFDCEKFVEKVTLVDVRNERRGGTGETKHYFNNYVDEQIPCSTKEKSFISFLESKGIQLEKLNNQKILILENI